MAEQQVAPPGPVPPPTFPTAPVAPAVPAPAAPVPAAPVPSAPVPAAPVSSAPLPTAALPTVSVPAAGPLPTAPTAPTPVAPAPVPAAPLPATLPPCPPTEPQGPAGYATTAAAIHGWGKPNRVDEFDGPLDGSWNVYDGPGHAGNGRRTPDAVSIKDGLLTITGDSAGATAGMAWNPGQKYGRWEGRVKAPASDESYNALLLLWPDAENFPVGGEVDFMEMMDHTRQTTNMFLHYGADNSQESGEVKIDATQWHNWAVEWTPTHVAAFVDGKEWWRTTDVNILPPGPMHLCVQLDWFPHGGDVRQSHMLVDWVRQYPINVSDVVADAPGDVGRALESIGNVAGSLVEGISTSVQNELLGRVTKPHKEGWPDPVPARKGLVEQAIPAPSPVPRPR